MDTPVPVEVQAQAGRNGSFEERMQEIRRQREQRTTELFEVPGFEGVFEVEMQVLGVKRMNDIAFKHTRVRDDSLRALYIQADQVMAATVGFCKVQPDGERAKAEDLTWMALARAYDPNLSTTVSPRAALVRLTDDGKGLGELHGSWYSWNTRGNEAVDKDLGRDFQVTPS
jgi:hypothetical protein